jgi:pilus assembly protein FimV
MYAARKDASAFETIAGELYTTLGADDPTWAKVAELGATVEPDNPLYDTSRIAASVPAAVIVTGSSAAAVADLDIGNDLDFSFEKAKPATEEAGDAYMSEADSSLDMQSSLSSQNVLDQNNLEAESFDLGGLTSEFSANATDSSVASASSTVEAAADNKLTADNSMDFDFPDLGSFASSTEASAAGNDLPSFELASQQDSAPLLELPSSTSDEIEFTAAAPAEESSALEGLDFNFTAVPDVNAPEVATASSDFNFEGFADAASPAEEEKINSGALDVTDFNFEDFGESVAEANDGKQQAGGLEGISLDFEAENNASAVADDSKVEEISFDFPLVDETESSTLEMQEVGSSQNEANNFDFSAISLDLSDSQPQDPAVTEVAADMAAPAYVAEAAVENENPDIDIKLDLVKVYIDMEDIEGARDLLDEVQKEGGPQQRLAAEKLLASLA